VVILGVVLVLVFAAFALNGILGNATNAIKNWVNSVDPHPAPWERVWEIEVVYRSLRLWALQRPCGQYEYD
jgi:hypothetical protein